MVEIGWQFALALGLLVLVGMAVALLGRLPVARTIPWAAMRAGVQLLAVSLIIGLVLQEAWSALLLGAAMFLVGVFTTCRRSGLTSPTAFAAAAVAMLAGALPVLVIVFWSGAAPFTGPSIVPIVGIVVGNMMSLHTLVARRAFSDLRAGVLQYEAWLSVGFPRSTAITEVISPTLHESLYPALDQTRTAGLVTLPGAYIGVLLGGGSPLDAAAAQVLVLIGVNTGQACTAVAARWLIAVGLLLPRDLRERLRP